MTDASSTQKQQLLSAESKTFSQFNEDGILQFLFSRLAPGNKSFVEFGIGNGKECNTANLSMHAGWSGLLMEGNAADVEKAGVFYNARPQVSVRQAFINAENINGLLQTNAADSPDLLSIDIDGMDLWVWRAITAIQPRVVVIEYNASFGADQSISVVYDPKFNRHDYHASGLYHGASLSALVHVGREKGYVLIGCESHGVNAFFVQRDAAAAAKLIELTPEQAYYPHAWRAQRFPSVQAEFQEVKHLPFVRID